MYIKETAAKFNNIKKVPAFFLAQTSSFQRLSGLMPARQGPGEDQELIDPLSLEEKDTVITPDFV